MKIGVVTTHYASNYGALLQTFALQKYLNENLNHDAEVLAYFPSHYRDYWRVFPQINSIKSFVLVGICLMQPWRRLKIKKRYRNFKKFVEKQIKCSKSYYSKEDIEVDECYYDALICGSDQIWNVARHENIQDVWFLNLNGNWTKAKRIAYAPSVADPIPKEKEKAISEMIKEFAAVSVRESSDVEIIEKLYSGKVEHVCDPVFLIDKQRWLEFASQPIEKEDYILCYFLNPGKDAINAVKKIKHLTGLKVIQIDINDYNKLPTDKNILDATPEEFVGYISGAKYVVTNSFHCTAFSVIFRKNLYVVKKKASNSRMESLLNVVDAQSRILDSKQIENLTLNRIENGELINDQKLIYFIQNSKNYLIRALEG